jgi:hypothetical protein
MEQEYVNVFKFHIKENNPIISLNYVEIVLQIIRMEQNWLLYFKL